MDVPPLFIYCLECKIGRIMLSNVRTYGKFNDRMHICVQRKLMVGVRPRWGRGCGTGTPVAGASIHNFHVGLHCRTTLLDFKTLNA